MLSKALANGGRFAEVFAERRHGFSMAIDESRIEAVQSGAEEGAGVRVVEGGTTRIAWIDLCISFDVAGFVKTTHDTAGNRDGVPTKSRVT